MCAVNLRVNNQTNIQDIAVLKFGGTSVRGIGRMQNVAQIVQSFAKQQKTIVVVSAMGDTTDHLYQLALRCAEQPDKRELDVLLSTGEQVSIALLTMILKSCGVRAKSFTGQQIGVLTEAEHGCARILTVDAPHILEELEDNDVIVVAGFQGSTVDGDITTLGRGGSDTSAVALAAAVGAHVCHIFTDVDGVFTADPNKVAGAVLIPEIGYDHCFEMARNGAQVIHDRSVTLAKQHGVQIRVRNTFNPGHSGTLICADTDIARTA
ncbi:MAG: aspartate kinase [Candidatus Obscuribacterales bacterium]